MDLEDVEHQLRVHPAIVGPRRREALIDLEESPHARAVVLGLLREDELRGTQVKLAVHHTR